MKKLKLRKIGNSYGVILPKEVLEHLQVREGDEVYASSMPEGVALTSGDPAFAAAMEHFDDFMHRYKNALRELAK